MARSHTSLAAQFLRDKAAFKASLEHPVLIWKAPPADASGQTWQGTHSGVVPVSRPQEGEAVVFDVKKDPKKQNAFAMGVTIGRIDTNDVPLDDVSVSRFHAWLQLERKAWVLQDAESKNGTFLNGARLAVKQKVVVKDNAKLKFGEVEVTVWHQVSKPVDTLPARKMI